jgi:hypothetical protein
MNHNSSVLEGNSCIEGIPASALSPNVQGSRTTMSRGEVKYMLDEYTYQKLRKAMRPYVEPDLFATTEVCSLYLDTPDNALIRRSLEKPKYKEKIRIRRYGSLHSLSDSCFIEIKKKVQGIVYKRRVEMTLQEAKTFCTEGIYPEASLKLLPEGEEISARQNLSEMAWCFRVHKPLNPSFYVSYKRLSLKEKNTDTLRITFDRDIRWLAMAGLWREGSPLPEAATTDLVAGEKRLMEIKAGQSMPLWLVHILNDLEIYPQSFSKAGATYRAWLKQQER